VNELKSWLKAKRSGLAKVVGIVLLIVLVVSAAFVPGREGKAYFGMCASFVDQMKSRSGRFPSNTAELVSLVGRPPAIVGQQDFYSSENDNYYFHFRWAMFGASGSCLTWRSYDRRWFYFNGPSCDMNSAKHPKTTCDPWIIGPDHCEAW
jgi:hypothetical protein